MPIYEYHCESCGSDFDRFLSLTRYAEVQRCNCGQVAKKLISTPAVFGDYPGYECPVTGKWIEGKKAHEANLRATGCHVYDPGEKREAEAARKAAEMDLENRIADTAARIVTALPAVKKERLAGELASGAIPTVERLSV